MLLRLQQQMDTVQGALIQQQQQQLQQAAPRAPEPPKIRQPGTFAGTMGFAVDDWISEMRQQFAYYDTRFPDDASKVRFAVAYLTGAAMHWWETQDPKTYVWSEFVDRLHARFRPVRAAMLARQKLGKLRQRPGQSVNQYAGIFQNILTPITDMGDTDQVHAFTNGLLPPLAAKVWEKNPADLGAAIDAAVSVEAMSSYGRAALPFGHRSTSSSSSATVANPDAMDLSNIEADWEVTDDHHSADASSSSHALLAKVAEQLSVMEMRLNALSSGKPSVRVPTRGNQRRGGRDLIDGLDAATIKKLQEEGRCFRCKEKGHMKNECPKKPKNE